MGFHSRIDDTTLSDPSPSVFQVGSEWPSLTSLTRLASEAHLSLMPSRIRCGTAREVGVRQKEDTLTDTCARDYMVSKRQHSVCSDPTRLMEPMAVSKVFRMAVRALCNIKTDRYSISDLIFTSALYPLIIDAYTAPL